MMMSVVIASHVFSVCRFRGHASLSLSPVSFLQELCRCLCLSVCLVCLSVCQTEYHSLTVCLCFLCVS
jgi:hypothetical protein